MQVVLRKLPSRVTSSPGMVAEWLAARAWCGVLLALLHTLMAEQPLVYVASMRFDLMSAESLCSPVVYNNLCGTVICNASLNNKPQRKNTRRCATGSTSR